MPESRLRIETGGLSGVVGYLGSLASQVRSLILAPGAAVPRDVTVRAPTTTLLKSEVSMLLRQLTPGGIGGKPALKGVPTFPREETIAKGFGGLIAQVRQQTGMRLEGLTQIQQVASRFSRDFYRLIAKLPKLDPRVATRRVASFMKRYAGIGKDLSQLFTREINRLIPILKRATPEHRAILKRLVGALRRYRGNWTANAHKIQAEMAAFCRAIISDVHRISEQAKIRKLPRPAIPVVKRIYGGLVPNDIAGAGAEEAGEKAESRWSKTGGHLRRVASLVSQVSSSFTRAGRVIGESLFAPLKILHNLHMEVRRWMFSALLFWYSMDRFFRPAAAVIRKVQAATIMATGAFKDWGTHLSYVSRLGGKFAVPLRQISEGYYTLTKAGFSAQESQNMLTASLSYATIHGSELQGVIGQLITVIHAWNLKGEDATRIVNSLQNAVAKSNLGINDLNTALGYVASSAGDLGISLNETLAAMMALRDAGVRAGRIGTGLRRVIQGLVQATARAVGEQMNAKDAIGVLEASGVQWKRLASAIENAGKGPSFFRVALEELNKVVRDGITVQERYAFKVLFGLRGVQVATLLARKRKEILEENIRKLEENARLEEKAAQVTSQFAGIFDVLNNLWLIFRSGVLEGLGTFGNEFTKTTTSIADSLLQTGKRIGTMIAKEFGIENLFKGIGGGLPKTIEWIAGEIMGFIKYIGRGIKESARILMDAFGMAIGKGKGVGETIGAVVSGILIGLSKVSAIIIKIINEIMKAIGGGESFEKTVAKMVQVFATLKLGVAAVLTPFTSLVKLGWQLTMISAILGKGGLFGGAAAGKGAGLFGGAGFLGGAKWIFGKALLPVGAGIAGAEVAGAFGGGKWWQMGTGAATGAGVGFATGGPVGAVVGAIGGGIYGYLRGSSEEAAQREAEIARERALDRQERLERIAAERERRWAEYRRKIGVEITHKGGGKEEEERVYETIISALKKEYNVIATMREEA